MELKEGDRKIDEGKLTYSTKAQDTDFEFEDWGVYQVIGFMADKYFAGYKATRSSTEVSMISDGQLRKVLIDDDKEIHHNHRIGSAPGRGLRTAHQADRH